LPKVEAIPLIATANLETIGVNVENKIMNFEKLRNACGCAFRKLGSLHRRLGKRFLQDLSGKN